MKITSSRIGVILLIVTSMLMIQYGIIHHILKDSDDTNIIIKQTKTSDTIMKRVKRIIQANILEYQ